MCRRLRINICFSRALRDCKGEPILPMPSRAPRTRLFSSLLVCTVFMGISFGLSVAQAQTAAPSPTWTAEVKALGALGVADNGDVLFIGSDARLHRLSSNGQQLWTFALGDTGRAQPVITPQGNVLAVAYDDTLYSISPDGQKLWSVRLGGGDLYASPALRSDGSIIVASTKGIVYALNAQGQPLWNIDIGAAIFSSPVVAQDGSIYFGTQGNAFVALTAEGRLKWSYRTGSTIFGSPALDAAGNIYFGSGNKNIYSLTPQGQLRWTRRTGSFVNASPIVTASDLVVVGSYDGNVYALTTEGKDAWVYLAGAPIAAPAAELSGNEVVVGDLSGTLHAIGKSGKALWTLKTGERIDLSVNLSASGTLYFATASGNLSALEGQPPLADGPWTHVRNVAAGYGRALTPIEAQAISALKRPAAQRALALAASPQTDANAPAGQAAAAQTTAAQTIAAQPVVTPPADLSTAAQISSQPPGSNKAAAAQAAPATVQPATPAPDPAALARRAAQQARSDQGQIVLPLDSVLGALGAKVAVQTPRSVTLTLGQATTGKINPQKTNTEKTTLPLRWSEVGGQRTAWLALADLPRLRRGGVAGVGRYNADAKTYTLMFGAQPALVLDLDFAALLTLKPPKEYPDVIDKKFN